MTLRRPVTSLRRPQAGLTKTQREAEVAKIVIAQVNKIVDKLPRTIRYTSPWLNSFTDGHGKAVVKTVQGGALTATLEGKNVVLTDEKGGKATVVATDLKAGNGVIHVIDAVVMHK